MFSATRVCKSIISKINHTLPTTISGVFGTLLGTLSMANNSTSDSDFAIRLYEYQLVYQLPLIYEVLSVWLIDYSTVPMHIIILTQLIKHV